MTVFEIVGTLTVAAALFVLLLIEFEHSDVASSKLRPGLNLCWLMMVLGCVGEDESQNGKSSLPDHQLLLRSWAQRMFPQRRTQEALIHR